MGGAGGLQPPPTFQQEGLSPPNVHMLSLLFNVEPPQLLNHSYAYGIHMCIVMDWSKQEKDLDRIFFKNFSLIQR